MVGYLLVVEASLGLRHVAMDGVLLGVRKRTDGSVDVIGELILQIGLLGASTTTMSALHFSNCVMEEILNSVSAIDPVA